MNDFIINMKVKMFAACLREACVEKRSQFFFDTVVCSFTEYTVVKV